MKRMKMLVSEKRNCSLAFGFAVLIFLTSISVTYAQTDSGRISGTVTDSTGSTVANTTLTVINPATNYSRTATTDENGFYTFTNLPVGTYTVSAEITNFKKGVKTGNVLNADGRLTVDFKLDAGDISEVVTVTQENGETVNTTSGEVGKTIDSEQISNLALNGRNYIQLLTIIPGAVSGETPELDDINTDNISVNGNRGTSNNMLVDGANNTNNGSNQNQINNVGVDTIQEVKVQNSNFSAEYGRSAGAQINVITKRGTNRYHGTMFEFLRNDAFDAYSPGAVSKPLLRYHDYGYTIGGPMPFFNFGEGGPMFTSGKDKFFFFFGQEWKVIHRTTGTFRRSFPTTAELTGDFSYRLRGADGIVGTADDGVLRDPLSTSPCTAPTVTNGVVTRAAVRTGCFSQNKIPTNRITIDGQAFANFYRRFQGLAQAFNDSPVGNNATFQLPTGNDFRQETLRLDYILNKKHTIYGRYIHDTNGIFDPFGPQIASSLPTVSGVRERPGVGIQVGHLWNVSSNVINDLKFNNSFSNQKVVPNTDNWKRSTYGFAFKQVFPNGGEYEDSIPAVSSMSSYSSWSSATSFLTAQPKDYAITDTLTWVKNNHTLKFGGIYNWGLIHQNGRPTYAGTMSFSNTAVGGSTNAFADALLGRFSTYTESAIDPVADFQYIQPAAFVMDSWRVTPKLSLELGLRWQYSAPYFASSNIIANFDPNYYDFTKEVVLSNNGNTVTVPAGVNRYNGLVRPDAPVPAVYNDATVFPAVANVPAVLPRGIIKTYQNFMPRVGFAYSPFKNNKTSIRGGFGMYYDMIQGQIIFPLVNNPPFVNSVTYNNGYLSDITQASLSASTGPFSTITSIDPDMKPPTSMSFSLGVQRELPWGIFAEVNGVGNLGRHLTRQVDINSVPFATQLANPTVNVNLLRKYKGYSTINQRQADGVSNYYAMQAYAAKRSGDLLATLAFTWSKVIGDATGLSTGSEDGLTNRSFIYGPLPWDCKFVVAATYTYTLPFFKGATGWKKSLLWGYELSGISRFQTGAPLTITGPAFFGGTRRVNVISGVPLYLNEGEKWLNPAAFSPVADTTRGNSGIGTVRSPGLIVNDISIRKRFRLGERKDLRLQADLFNAFNHANFNSVDTTCNDGTPTLGQFITCADPAKGNTTFGDLDTNSAGRRIQLGIKFVF